MDGAARGKDFGRPGNYLARQIARWSRTYVEDVEAGRDPHMDRLIEWLPKSCPVDDQTSIVHGDYRMDNMVMHATEPRVVAVLDWELATLGNPLADFSYVLMQWVNGAIAAMVVAWFRPDQFHKVLSNVGSFVNLRGGDAFPELIAKADRKPIRVFLADGRNDTRGQGRGGTYDPPIAAMRGFKVLGRLF